MKFNRVFIVGRLCKDPELQESRNGKPFVNIRLAVDQKQGDSEEALFISAFLWGRQAKTLCKHLTTGQELMIEGRLVQRHWIGDDDQKRNTFIIQADRFHFTGKKYEDAPVEVEIPEPEEKTAEIAAAPF